MRPDGLTIWAEGEKGPVEGEEAEEAEEAEVAEEGGEAEEERTEKRRSSNMYRVAVQSPIPYRTPAVASK